MSVLEVNKLCKNYPSFRLDDVSFCLEEGKITGFIGRNGAGKSTTLKSILGLVHPDAGQISFFGMPFNENELEIKSRIAFAAGETDYFPHKKMRTLTEVTKRFYPLWDEETYARYMKSFGLDENKTPSELSSGMRVKYSLALALSHNAELIILDEPTSGLDPVSRDELLDILMDLSERGTTIFFSTHITSDLDKCADDIVFIRSGKIAAFGSLDEFLSRYRVARFGEEGIPQRLREKAQGIKRMRDGTQALFLASDAQGLTVRTAGLDDIMTMARDAQSEN
jgi:ABC-2 type transport system ATP-binding protein